MQFLAEAKLPGIYSVVCSNQPPLFSLQKEELDQRTIKLLCEDSCCPVQLCSMALPRVEEFAEGVADNLVGVLLQHQTCNRSKSNSSFPHVDISGLTLEHCLTSALSCECVLPVSASLLIRQNV